MVIADFKVPETAVLGKQHGAGIKVGAHCSRIESSKINSLIHALLILEETTGWEKDTLFNREQNEKASESETHSSVPEDVDKLGLCMLFGR